MQGGASRTFLQAMSISIYNGLGSPPPSRALDRSTTFPAVPLGSVASCEAYQASSGVAWCPFSYGGHSLQRPSGLQHRLGPRAAASTARNRQQPYHVSLLLLLERHVTQRKKGFTSHRLRQIARTPRVSLKHDEHDEHFKANVPTFQLKKGAPNDARRALQPHKTRIRDPLKGSGHINLRTFDPLDKYGPWVIQMFISTASSSRAAMPRYMMLWLSFLSPRKAYIPVITKKKRRSKARPTREGDHDIIEARGRALRRRSLKRSAA